MKTDQLLFMFFMMACPSGCWPGTVECSRHWTSDSLIWKMGKDGCCWRDGWVWLSIVGLRSPVLPVPGFERKGSVGLGQVFTSIFLLPLIASGLPSGHCVVGWAVRVSGSRVCILTQACPSVFHLLDHRCWLRVRQWLNLVHEGQAWDFAGMIGNRASSVLYPLRLLSYSLWAWTASSCFAEPWMCLCKHEVSREESPSVDRNRFLMHVWYTSSSQCWKPDQPVEFSLTWICSFPFLVYAFSAFYQSFHPKAFKPRILALLTSQLGGNCDGVCMKGSE